MTRDEQTENAELIEVYKTKIESMAIRIAGQSELIGRLTDAVAHERGEKVKAQMELERVKVGRN